MTMSNSDRVGGALKLLSKGLALFIERELKQAYGDVWAPTVIDLLGLDTYQAQKFSLDDVQFQLKVMWKLWQPVFGKVLGQSERTLVSELIDARNAWAHQESFSTDDAYRALDSVQRLLTAVSASEADELRESKQELLRILNEELGASVLKPGSTRPGDGATSVRVFSEKLGPGQREEFQAWLTEHLDNGFYVNCAGPTMTLHRATCPHLELDGAGSTVRKKKGCSTSLSDLERWAAERGGNLRSCRTCAPRA